MLAAVDWMLVVLVALVALSITGLATVLVGRRIERDADATADNYINRARKRSGGRFMIIGGFATLSCTLAAVVMALLIAMPIQR